MVLVAARSCDDSGMATIDVVGAIDAVRSPASGDEVRALLRGELISANACAVAVVLGGMPAPQPTCAAAADDSDDDDDDPPPCVSA